MRFKTFANILLTTSAVAATTILSTMDRSNGEPVVADSSIPVPMQPVAFQEKQRPAKLYFGLLACSNGGCHSTGVKANQGDIILCDYNEVNTWLKSDKHKDANTVLKGERGQQMGRLLGIPEVATHASCISCHGVLVDDPKHKHSSFKLEDGVSCVACHGPYKDWVGKHSDFLERDNWRSLSRGVKEELYGMRDLWDPEKRANLCASCHIGNTAEGKVVTHAMYAAGHPPLPGIEMAAFSNAMPRHWKYLAEKNPKVQKILGYEPGKSSLEQTQLVVIAGVVSFRESMHLLATQASAEEKSWPELAQFDCYACHHDLKANSWRQKRGYSGKPGRPEIRPWSTALIDVGIQQAGRGKPDLARKLQAGYQHNMKELLGVFHQQPFGQPQRVAKAAAGMAQWADDLLGELRPVHFDKNSARAILTTLGDTAKTRLLDFDSARQFGWAFRSIQTEIEPGVLQSGLMKELDAQLQLDLPHGQVEISREYLRSELEKLSNYEPERFRGTFGQLIQRMEKSKE